MTQSDHLKSLKAPDCPEPAIEADRHLNILGLNPAAVSLFGFESREVIGRPLLETLLKPPQGQPAPFASGGVESRIIEANTKSGQSAFVVLTAIPTGDQGGFFFLAFDITMQHLAQSELSNKRAVDMVLSSITSRLLETSPDDLGRDIDETMRTLSMFLDAHCCYLCRTGSSPDQAKLLGGWWQEPVWEIKQPQLQNLLYALPGLLSLLGQMHTVQQTMDEPQDQPDDSGQPGRDYLQLRGARAMIAVPLIVEERMLGFLACERRSASKGWPPDEQVLLRTVAESLSSALARLDAEERLREQTEYLTLLADTLQTGVMVSDVGNESVLDVNQHAQQLIGAPLQQIVGAPRSNFLERLESEHSPGGEAETELESSEWILKSPGGRPRKVLRTAARASGRTAGYLVECFSDISALKNLMDDQAIDIGQAKRLLELVEGPRPRHLDLSGGLGLFVSALSLSCMAEGGDHYFVRELEPSGGHTKGRVLISLKDQSGHQVGCVLRSILTDLLHQYLISRAGDDKPETVVQRLNELLCGHDLIGGDDFLTAIICQIDKASGALRYVSCGHPRFLLVRDAQARLLPAKPGVPGSNLPLGFVGGRDFSAGEVELKPSDMIIFYTDGLLEAAGASGAEGGAFDSQDLVTLVAGLLKRNPGMGVGELLREVLAKIALKGNHRLSPEGVNQSDDDVTIIGLAIEPLAWDHQETWSPANLEQLQDSMDRYFKSLEKQWRQRSFARPARLKMCLEEAAANAFLHGNLQQPGAAITLRHRWGNDFHLQVTDRGPGFDHTNSPGISEVSNPENESGRGLFLIKWLTSQVSWNQAGNQINLAFAPNEKTNDPTGLSLRWWPKF